MISEYVLCRRARISKWSLEDGAGFSPRGTEDIRGRVRSKDHSRGLE